MLDQVFNVAIELGKVVVQTAVESWNNNDCIWGSDGQGNYDYGSRMWGTDRISPK